MICSHRLRLVAALALVLAGFAAPALAHVGGQPTGLAAGLVHPFSGLDHVLAMLAVGLWASQLPRPACWLLPLIFPAAMLAGALAPISGLPLRAVDPAAAASVLVLGALIALALRPLLAIALSLTVLFALVHGYSHAAESPALGSALAYDAGFVASTFALHLAGFGFGVIAQRASVPTLARGAGAAIAIAGAALLISV